MKYLSNNQQPIIDKKINRDTILRKCALLSLFLTVFTHSYSQVQRNIEGMSIIRENIKYNNQFHFFRDWNIVASFRSGIGETVVFFPITFKTPDGKTTLSGLQLNAEVKPQRSDVIIYNSGSSGVRALNKEYLRRSIFIDKEDTKGMITFIERDIIPNLKTTYKKQSNEFVFKTNEMFFSYLIDENDVRITMHISDFGPLGDGFNGGQEIEFWTEAKVDDMPKFLESLKAVYAKMK